jgi:hypothetical protein
VHREDFVLRQRLEGCCIWLVYHARLAHTHAHLLERLQMIFRQKFRGVWPMRSDLVMLFPKPQKNGSPDIGFRS